MNRRQKRKWAKAHATEIENDKLRQRIDYLVGCNSELENLLYEYEKEEHLFNENVNTRKRLSKLSRSSGVELEEF